MNYEEVIDGWQMVQSRAGYAESIKRRKPKPPIIILQRPKPEQNGIQKSTPQQQKSTQIQQSSQQATFLSQHKQDPITSNNKIKQNGNKRNIQAKQLPQKPQKPQKYQQYQHQRYQQQQYQNVAQPVKETDPVNRVQKMLDSKTVLPPPGFTPSSNESFIAQLAAQLCSVAAVLQHEMQKRTLDKLHELTAANETLTTSVAKLQGALSQARAYTKELERELLEIKASRPKMPQSHSDLKKTVGSSLNLGAKAFIPRKQLSPSN